MSGCRLLACALVGLLAVQTALADSLATVEWLSEQRRLGEAEVLLSTLRRAPAAIPAALDLEAARIALRRGQYVLAEQRILLWFDTHGDAAAALKQRATVVLAQARFEQGELDRAAQELAALKSTDPLIRGEIAYALAAVELARGEADAATARLRPALAEVDAAKAPLLRAQLLCYLAYAALLRGDVREAGDSVREALGLRAVHAAGSVSEGVALYFLAHVLRAEGDVRAANAALLGAIERLERERVRQSGSDDTQAQWAVQFSFFYREAVTQALAAGDAAGALQWAQRWRRGHAPNALPTLSDDTQLLSYVVHDRRVLVLSWFRGQGRHRELALDARALADAVAAVQVLIAARSHADPAALRERLAELHDALVGPLLEPKARRLLLQTDGPLHALPFAALVRNGPRGAAPRYLIEDLVLARVDVLDRAMFDSGTASAAMPPWIVGDPRAGSSDPLRGEDGALPGAEREARQVATLYPSARLLLGSAATESSLRRLPAGVDLHIAAHMRRDPLDEQRSYIALARSDGSDGQLDAAEIVQDFAGARALVVLSGCGSLRGVAIDSGALSLAHAWHRAGAAQVLSTLWPVADAATTDTMVQFHRHRLAHGDVALALAQAQRDWLRAARSPGWSSSLASWWRREPADRLLQPFYWAGLVVSQ